ncbi:MAG: hypothetical protein ACLF0G_04370 [Candidatus Brocadiia bacterium]
MARDLNATVEDYRRGLAAQNREIERLQAMVRELEEQAHGIGSRRIEKSLRRARHDLRRAQAERADLQREYARFRLREFIGDDPAHIDTQLFDEELLRVTSARLARRRSGVLYEGRISADSFRTALLADLPLDQLIENERSERKAGVILDLLDEHTSTKAILRHWAALVQSDDYVCGVLHRAEDATARFEEHLANFTRGLENLRIDYELRQRKVDDLLFSFDDGRPALLAANYWDNIERLCASQVQQLFGQFLGLDRAREELRVLREELNEELRQFMRAFVPRYLAYAASQGRRGPRRMRLGWLATRRLCRYVLDEVDRTDLLLPQGGGMEIPLPRVPRNIAAFRKLKSYRRFKESGEAQADAESPTTAQGTR